MKGLWLGFWEAGPRDPYCQGPTNCQVPGASYSYNARTQYTQTRKVKAAKAVTTGFVHREDLMR